jgi:SAM-dependent methyltransferase
MTSLLLLFCLIATSIAALRVKPANSSYTRSATSLGPLQADQIQIHLPIAVQSVVNLRQQPNRKRPLRHPDVIYYPTPDETVAEMLRLADIKQGDVLYDLGSGDGRITIMAAQQYGIRTVGVEIDPKMVSIAEERARQADVHGLVSFRNADMFRINVGEATVVTLYLSNKLNLLLRPKLLAELRPGSRILSHDFHMGDWKAERTIRVPWEKGLYRTIYLWRVPARRIKRSARSSS